MFGTKKPSVVATAVAAVPEGEGPRWLRYVAMWTGVLAAAAAFLTVRSTNLANDAIFHSNQAVLYQALASDAWAEYQANSIKARVVETTLAAGGVADAKARDALAAEAKEVRDRQPAAKQLALDKQWHRDNELVGVGRLLKAKDLLGYAGVAVQLGIALASVAALTRQKLAFAAGLVVGAAGLLLAGYTMAAAMLGKG